MTVASWILRYLNLTFKRSALRLTLVLEQSSQKIYNYYYAPDLTMRTRYGEQCFTTRLLTTPRKPSQHFYAHNHFVFKTSKVVFDAQWNRFFGCISSAKNVIFMVIDRPLMSWELGCHNWLIWRIYICLPKYWIHCTNIMLKWGGRRWTGNCLHLSFRTIWTTEYNVVISQDYTCVR